MSRILEQGQQQLDFMIKRHFAIQKNALSKQHATRPDKTPPLQQKHAAKKSQSNKRKGKSGTSSGKK